MAYAAYREHPAAAGRRSVAALRDDGFHVLDVTVGCTDALRVRRSLAACEDVGVVRCEPLLHAGGAQENDAPRVRLMIRLPLRRHAEVLHRLLECVPAGEIGRLVSWRAHLARCGLRSGAREPMR